jgi:microcystin-dependent protein
MKRRLRSILLPLAGVLGLAVVTTAMVHLRHSGEVPIGTVVAYAGDPDNLPDGWLLADGRSLRQAEYPELYAATGTTHGTGVTTTGQKEIGYDFNLPDYRGLFLRGVDQDANGVASGRDPDASDREPARGGTGNRGNRVGAYQPHAMQSHTHRDQGHGHTTNGIRYPGDQWVDREEDEKAANNDSRAASVGTGHARLGDPVDSETGAGAVAHGKEVRPKNAGVWWIVRAR